MSDTHSELAGVRVRVCGEHDPMMHSLLSEKSYPAELICVMFLYDFLMMFVCLYSCNALCWDNVGV